MDVRRRLRTIDASAVALIGALLLGACASSSPATTTVATSSATTPTTRPSSASLTPSSATTPTPRPSRASLTPSSAITNPAPRELQGTWTATVKGGHVTLTIRPGAYVIQGSGEGGGGKLAVTGDQVELSNSTICQATGTYRWDVADEELTLTAVGKDPCSGRAHLFDGIRYQLALPPP
jgi:hypothetical protein